MSLMDLDRLLERIGQDPRPQGVIITLRGLQMPLADLQTLRDSLLRLRQTGKKVIFYAQGYDNAAYYIAAAGDEIILQPGGTLDTIGLISQPTFFKNALDAVGVQLDSVAISPYKGAFDSFTREMISPEGQAQLEWLLDSRYDLIVEGIAAGRKLSAEAVREMIDHAPYLDTTALAAGYIDAVCNEEQLAAYLGVEHLVPLDKAKKYLLRPWRKRHRQYVAVLPLTGMIVPGESASPPGNIPVPLPILGEDRLGDITVVNQVRELMDDEDAAAVVLWIDSPGGSATASEAMTSALDELAKSRPVVAYMNAVAASGGYYVATPAQWIIAQPGTITGSIGVILAKAITNGLYQNLRVNRLEFMRGANASLLSDGTPFNDQQRVQMRQLIEHAYQQFIGRVAVSRKLSLEAVDAVGGGRVWTGQQALAHHLVDELGDWQSALAKARTLAGLDAEAPFRIIHDKAKPLAPQVAEQANPAAGLIYLHENLQMVAAARSQFLLPMSWD
jgi:protease-4